MPISNAALTRLLICWDAMLQMDVLGTNRIGVWRRERDSNPRRRCRLNGFQVRRFQPLTHPSVPSNYPKFDLIPQV